MTKAKARLRAKARGGKKTRKPEVNTNRPDEKLRPGKFDPGPGTIASPRMGAQAKNFAGARRGAARSK